MHTFARQFHRFARKARRRTAAEGGIALPTVLFATIAAFALGTAAVTVAISSQSGATRDLDTKAALAAAEAGVSNALLRYNRISTEEADICAPIGGTVPREDGWCPTAVVGEGGGGTYRYWVKPSLTDLEIVSAGTVDRVTRRVHVEADSAQSPPGGLKPFGEFSVIGLDYITQAQNSEITANAATNGDITLAQNSWLRCDGAQVGPGRDIKSSSNSGYTCPPYGEGELELPPLNQGDVATNNDNHRITLARNGQSGGDTISGKLDRVDWDPNARTLVLSQNVSITLGGSNYSLCRLETKQNTTIFVVSGQAVRIYFDSPENCGFTSATTQLKMNQNSSIEVTGGSALDLALLFVGSESIPTSIELAQNTQAPGPCAQNFVLYAPRSSVNLAQNSYICGAIAAKSVAVAQNTKITTNAEGAAQFELPNTEKQYFLGYAPHTFVECTAINPSSGAPDQGC